MSLQFAAARFVSSVSTWGLKNVFRRPAANFPGKAALYVDPQAIAHASNRLSKGSIVVVGTNGKTTVTNLLADVLEAAGERVTCNRTGANLGSGVATALLHAKQADWGVFESDELWLAKMLPQLQATYVVLLNLFRDQLDRMGRSAASRTASWARWPSRPTRCCCTTQTTRCAPPSPIGRKSGRWASASTRTWAFRRTPWPMRRCARNAPACSNTSTGSTASWETTAVPPADSRGPLWTTRCRTCAWKPMGCRSRCAGRGLQKPVEATGRRCARRSTAPTWCTTWRPSGAAADLLGCPPRRSSAPSTRSILRTGACKTFDLDGRRRC